MHIMIMVTYIIIYSRSLLTTSNFNLYPVELVGIVLLVHYRQVSSHFLAGTLHLLELGELLLH